MSNLYILGINSNASLSFNYDTYLVDATANNITLILPDISLGADGATFNIARLDNVTSRKVFITPSNSTTLLNGLNTASLSPNGQLNPRENVQLVVLNGAWFTVQGKWIQ